MSEMIERVAMALSVPQHHTTWELLSEMEKDLFYMQARAAIEAMREPTETMLTAAAKLSGETGVREGGVRSLVRRDWSAMIDAALNPGDMS